MLVALQYCGIGAMVSIMMGDTDFEYYVNILKKLTSRLLTNVNMFLVISMSKNSEKRIHSTWG